METNAYKCVALYRNIMEGIIEDAIQNNKEMGMNFYTDKNGVYSIGPICIGEECAVRLSRVPQKKEIGSFHTHVRPMSESVLSAGDFQVFLHDKEQFMCVGSKKDGIRCFSIIHSPEVTKFNNECNKLESNFHNVESQIRYAAKFIHRKNSYIEEYLYPEPGVYIPEVIDDVLRSSRIIHSLAFSPITTNFLYSCKLIIDYLGKIVDHNDQYYSVYSASYDVYIHHINNMVELKSFYKSIYSKILHECKLS
ncbi:hypothetical protein KAW18_11610 [candidate division WOR-3 bacterium]|nr:hypothetical protein [candidate division WOR-3 bacterium]